MRDYLKSKQGLTGMIGIAICLVFLMLIDFSRTLEILILVGVCIVGGLIFYGIFLKYKLIAYILESVWIGTFATGFLYWLLSNNTKTHNLLWQDRLVYSAIMGFFSFLISLPFGHLVFKTIRLFRNK